jgi:hypothetical protein
MIESGGVLQLMRFGASMILRTGVDEQVAMALDLIARRPSVDVIPIAASSDEVNVDDSRGECAFPSALPIWRGRATCYRESYECE